MEYLETETTTHAILINGKWGSGKTFFWKNILKGEVVEKTKSPHSKKTAFYRSIYISLSSVKSLDDVIKGIMFGLFGLDGNTFIKKAVVP